jgi:hypothetical protein
MKFTRRMMMTAGAVLASPNFITDAQAQVRARAQGQTINTRIGKLSFTHDFANGYPTNETVEKIYNERDFQRACQIYLWAIPLVSFGEFEHVLMSAPGAANGDIIRVDTVPAIKRFLTGNATTPYMMSWLNLAKSGPFVVDMPAGASAGFVNDMWQRPVTDLGQPEPDRARVESISCSGPARPRPKVRRAIPSCKAARSTICGSCDCSRPRLRNARRCCPRFACIPSASAPPLLPPR